MDPIPAWVRRLWDEWDLRLLVLLSLALQIILSLFGNRRKYISSPWISILLWSAYLMADWVATVALGKLSDAEVNYDNGNTLGAIWAPLLLLHLGGPDTITAFSLEDNRLWLRHLFGLGVQVSVAVYVILMSWKHSWFSIMSIPALVAGFIKYGERTWVLLSPDEEVVWSLLGIKRWVEEHFKYTLKKYVPETAVIDPSPLFHPISECCIHLIDPRNEEDIMIRTIEEDPSWKEFFDMPLEEQIMDLRGSTEICYDLEMQWDTEDAAYQNNRDGTVSQQHTMPGPSDSSSSWEGNRELCRTLSRYMIYLLVMRSSLLPIAASYYFDRDGLHSFVRRTFGSAGDGSEAGVRSAMENMSGNPIFELLKSKQKDLRWETLKWVWVRMLCHAASKGQRNEHFRQLSQGGEFLTFLWFFLPQSKELLRRP
ncbi:hypothetical protein C3L33_20212, partial [Rhododendron williamsianum]